MAEAYTTPFDVWQRIGRATRHQKSRVKLDTSTIVQLESHVIPTTLQLLDDNNNEVPETDYEIDTDFDQLKYTGEDSIQNATINYYSAPAPHDRAVRGVEQATSHVDNLLDTTFGGLRRRKEEIYKTDDISDTVINFMEMPVRDVETVWLNENNAEDEPPQWKEIEEDKDWVQHGKTGIKLNNSRATTRNDVNLFSRSKLSNSQKQIKVTYTYGYEDVPGDIQNLAEIVLSTDLFLDTVFGSGVDGRDGFNPQSPTQYRDKVEKIEQEWGREFYNNFSTLIEEGEEEVV